MDLEAVKALLINFLKSHQIWAPVIVGLLAFGESLAIISILIPATVLLLGVGYLIAEGGLSFFPVWMGAAAGAYLGDSLSYFIGFYYKKKIFRIWPLYLFPQTIFKGRRFFRRYGLVSIFLGRFFGPVRAIIPLIAGVFQMPWTIFQISNLTSAFIWSLMLLAPGMGIHRLLNW